MFVEHQSFLWDHGNLCFGLQMTSAIGIWTRVVPSHLLTSWWQAWQLGRFDSLTFSSSKWSSGIWTCLYGWVASKIHLPTLIPTHLWMQGQNSCFNFTVLFDLWPAFSKALPEQVNIGQLLKWKLQYWWEFNSWQSVMMLFTLPLQLLFAWTVAANEKSM